MFKLISEFLDFVVGRDCGRLKGDAVCDPYGAFLESHRLMIQAQINRACALAEADHQARRRAERARLSIEAEIRGTVDLVMGPGAPGGTGQRRGSE
jgi:hypothetical protein